MLQLFLEDIAGSEILLILVFILIFFGSKSIPSIAQTLGKTIRQIRDASDELKHEIKNSTNEIKKDFDLQKTINTQINSIQLPLDQMSVELEKSVQEDGIVEEIKDNLTDNQEEKKSNN